MSILESGDKNEGQTGKGFYDTLKNYANESANGKPEQPELNKAKDTDAPAKDAK